MLQCSEWLLVNVVVAVATGLLTSWVNKPLIVLLIDLIY